MKVNFLDLYTAKIISNKKKRHVMVGGFEQLILESICLGMQLN